MRAIRMHGVGGPEQLIVEEVAEPNPGPGEVLIRVAATSINPVDYKVRNGIAKGYLTDDLPAILGRDVVGTIVDVTINSLTLEPGDRVMGIVARSHAEFVVAQASDLCLVPDGLSDEQAGAMPLVATTGAQLIEEAGQVKRGDTVLVTGALGGVGRTAVYVAKQLGARVFAGVRKSQREAAKRLGVDGVVPLDDDRALSDVPALDVLADTVGGAPTVKLAAHLKPGGRLATAVGPPSGLTGREVHIVAFKAHPDAARLQQLAEDIVARRFELPIGRVMKFSEAREAHRLAEEGGHGKIVLVP